LKTDEEINDAMEFTVMDNLPFIKSKYGYSRQRADSEFPKRDRMSDLFALEPKCLEGGNANELENAQKFTLADLYNSMEHERLLVMAIIFKESSEVKHEFFMDKRQK
jgi:hypothetical protein